MSRLHKYRHWTGERMVYYQPLELCEGRDWLVANFADAEPEDFWIDDHFSGKPAENLMEWIGLKDKNGVDIYESDIIHCWDDDEQDYLENVEVIWLHDCWGFHAPGNDIYLRPVDWDEYEVIGNIHEHPHLLEANG